MTSMMPDTCGQSRPTERTYRCSAQRSITVEELLGHKGLRHAMIRTIVLIRESNRG